MIKKAVFLSAFVAGMLYGQVNFVDAVSSATYGLKGGDKPALSFRKKSKQVSVGGERGVRPDAETSATYTLRKDLGNGRAIYKNGAGSCIGFILLGGSIQKTAPAASEKAVDFNKIDGTYTK